MKLSAEVRTPSGLALSLPEQPRFRPEQLARLSQVNGVREVLQENPFPVYVIGSNRLAGGAQHRSWGHPWSTAIAEPFTLSDGQEPIKANHVVLNRSVAESTGKRVGDEVSVMTAGGNRDFMISGVGDWQGSEYENALFFSPTTAKELGGSPILALLRLAPDVNASAVASGVRSALPEAAVLSGAAKSRALVLDRSQAELSSGTGTFIGTISVCALAIAVFVISSTLSVSVMQRRRELALLRSVGASPGRIRVLVLGEAAFIGVLAGALGGLAGVGLADAAIQFFVAQGLMPRQISLVVGVQPFVIGAGVAVLAGVLPAWRAARISPSDAMRTVDVQPAPPKRRRVLWGLVNLLTAGIFIGAGTISGIAGGTMALQIAPVMMFMAAPFLVLAAVLLGRHIIGAVLTLLSPVLRRSFGGFIGEREIRSDLGRAVGVSTPLMLMVALACLMLFQDVATYEAKSRTYDSRLTADVVMGGTEQLGLQGSVVKEVTALPGVRAASGTLSTRILPLDGDAPRTTVDVMGVDPTAGPAVFDLPARTGKWADFGENSIAVSAAVAEDYGWEAGQDVRFLLPDGTPSTARVSTVYESGTIAFTSAMLPRNVISPHVLKPLDSGVYVALDNDAALSGLSSNNPALTILSREQRLAEVARQSSGDNWIMYSVVALIGGYSGIAAINVLTGSAMSRKRRFAQLRLAGARTSHVLTSVGFEVAVTVVSGILTGSAIAAVVLAGYSYALTGQLWIPFPPGQYFAICAAAVFAGAVGSLLPARLALRTSALDSVS